MSSSENVSCIIVGDPHFKVGNSSDTELMVSKILKEVTERKPNFVVVAGDVLDRFHLIDITVLTRAVIFIKELCKLAYTIVLIGNHDRRNNNDFLTDENPFVGMKDDNLLIC